MANYSFVVVANRLPVDYDPQQGFVPSPGGLVTALSPVLQSQHGCWIGWPGAVDCPPETLTPCEVDGYTLHPVALNAQEYEEFYEGFSNATLWPLYHDLIVTPTYDPTWWETYREVNLRFAHEVADVAAPGAIVWVQDYQLQLVPGILRLLRPDLKIGFFLHIPFPAPELFKQLPWRREILRGMLGADLLGFQLESGAQNFASLLAELQRVDPEFAANVGPVKSQIRAFPISIDTPALMKLADATPRAVPLAGNPRVILGVDRLDYTKGILQRLHAFEQLLESGAITPGEVVFIQIATPSRERIDHYQQTRSQVEEAVSRINGRFGEIGAPVVHYIHRSLSKEKLVAEYKRADIMLVTPFKDGMNLVAKEYVACHADGSGALVLSEFAGCAVELHRAYLCNPHDVESIKHQIMNALKAVSNSTASSSNTNPDAVDDARARMREMVAQVSTHDVTHWAAQFLGCLHSLPAPAAAKDTANASD